MIEVEAELAGVVSRIEKNPGQKVSRGETVIVLESMKMEVPVEAPANGTIVEIWVAATERVQDGQSLFGMEREVE